MRLTENFTLRELVSDTPPLDLNSAALGIGRHVSGIARSLQRPYRRVPHRARPAFRWLDQDNLEQHERSRPVRSSRDRGAGRRPAPTACRRRLGRLSHAARVGRPGKAACPPLPRWRAHRYHSRDCRPQLGDLSLGWQFIGNGGPHQAYVPSFGASPGTTSWSHAGALIHQGCRDRRLILRW